MTGEGNVLEEESLELNEFGVESESESKSGMRIEERMDQVC